MSIENVMSSRGAVLLAELKALVDSFPQHQRKELIKIFNIVFTSLNADYQSRHSSAGRTDTTAIVDRTAPSEQS